MNQAKVSNKFSTRIKSKKFKHEESFPNFKIYYNRKNTCRLHLSPNLNIHKNGL